jgi:hypothetical protein
MIPATSILRNRLTALQDKFLGDPPRIRRHPERSRSSGGERDLPTKPTLGFLRSPERNCEIAENAAKTAEATHQKEGLVNHMVGSQLHLNRY